MSNNPRQIAITIPITTPDDKLELFICSGGKNVTLSIRFDDSLLIVDWFCIVGPGGFDNVDFSILNDGDQVKVKVMSVELAIDEAIVELFIVTNDVSVKREVPNINDVMIESSFRSSNDELVAKPFVNDKDDVVPIDLANDDKAAS